MRGLRKADAVRYGGNGRFRNVERRKANAVRYGGNVAEAVTLPECAVSGRLTPSATGEFPTMMPWQDE